MSNVLVGYSREEGKTLGDSSFPLTFSIPAIADELLSHTRIRWMKALGDYLSMSDEEMSEELCIDHDDIEFMIVPEDDLNIVIMAESTVELPGNDSAVYALNHALKVVIECMAICSTEFTFCSTRSTSLE